MSKRPILARCDPVKRVLRDADVRPVVREWAKKFDQTTEEMTLENHRTRIDIGAVLDFKHGLKFVGIEIKGDTDALGSRWNGQRTHWEKIFDELWLVATPRRLEKILGTGVESRRLPGRWGLLSVDIEKGQLVLRRVRAPQRRENWRVPDVGSRARCLWKPDLLGLLKPKGVPRIHSMNKWQLCQAVQENCTMRELDPVLRDRFFNSRRKHESTQGEAPRVRGTRGG